MPSLWDQSSSVHIPHASARLTINQVLTGERTAGDSCFVCGKAGDHALPPLRPYPVEWNSFIESPNLARHSRQLNMCFTLTAMGVHGGSWMKFPSGLSSVTLNGGRTYHQLFAADQADHPLRWFVHDMEALRTRSRELELPSMWVEHALAGLRRVNPFVSKLENLSQNADFDEQLAVHLDVPQSVSAGDVAALISIAPVGRPAPRLYMVRLKGSGERQFLHHTSPLREPLHYPLLLPYGTAGWTIALQTPSGKKLSQLCFLRTRFFMNAPQMSRFSRLMGEPFPWGV
jgi:hypothetical protein